MKTNTDRGRFDIMGKRRVAVIISLLLLLVSIASIAIRGLNLGVDFTGGYLVEVGYPQPVDLAPIRAALKSGGFGDAVVQHFGTASDVLVRIAPREGVNSAHGFLCREPLHRMGLLSWFIRVFQGRALVRMRRSRSRIE